MQAGVQNSKTVLAEALETGANVLVVMAGSRERLKVCHMVGREMKSGRGEE